MNKNNDIQFLQPARNTVESVLRNRRHNLILKEGNMKTTHTQRSASRTDFWLSRMIVGVLGAVMLVCLVGAIILTLGGQPTPELLVAIGFTAVGSLGGLLAPSPLTKR